jgi:hypothetical protein
VVNLEQRQLMLQAFFSLANRIDPSSDGRYALSNVKIEPLDMNVLIFQPHTARTWATASIVPNTTRCFVSFRQACLTSLYSSVKSAFLIPTPDSGFPFR